MEKEDPKKFEQRNSEFKTDNDTAKDLKSNDHNKPAPKKNEDHDDYQNDDTDKYLAMEQQGVTYTKDSDFSLESDKGGGPSSNLWNEEGGNSKNSDAFNQDDYILNDNLDLDEDQNQSISTDDEDYEELNEDY